MKCLSTAALIVCAAYAPVSKANEPLKAGTVVVEEVYLPGTAARLERVYHWQAELAAREFEIRRAQTAWLPITPMSSVSSNVVRNRPTYSNSLFAVDRPYAFVPEPYYEMPNADRRSIAYTWSPYVFTTPAVAPAAVAPAPYWQAGAYAASYPRGPAEAAIQPVTPGPGPAVVNREAETPVRTARIIEEGTEIR
jgi:hypothetical protein